MLSREKRRNSKFDKAEADATADGHRHDNQNHSSMWSHIKWGQKANDTFAELEIETNNKDTLRQDSTKKIM